MGLVYRCDNCKKVIPAGDVHISVLVWETSGAPSFSHGYCTSCADPKMKEILAATLTGLIHRVEMRSEEVHR